ncbi:dynein axonemal intermediate chain 4 [Cololabis saira]|uniref:dynein axonemal intermediate chain 4 n=1 Tax=Cololabis saira TaxID=129043 RepID=UPI002AD3A7AE|nr:dynein axonemal intermediate chain 4 [Cololabis saira]
MAPVGAGLDSVGEKLAAMLANPSHPLLMELTGMRSKFSDRFVLPCLSLSGSGSFRRGPSSRFGSYLDRRGDRKRSELKQTEHAQKTPARVLDDGEDVTPLPLLSSEPGEVPSSLPTLDEIFSGSDFLKSTCSSNLQSSRLFSFMDSSYHPTLSSKNTEDSLLFQDAVRNLPAPLNLPVKRERVEDEVSDKVPYIIISETDTISLLDIPSTFVSEDDEDAEALKERDILYADLKKETGNKTYADHSVQTFNGALKNKQTQTSEIVMVDTAAAASVQDIYNSYCGQEEISEKENVAESTKRGTERTDGNSSSTAGSSTVSQLQDVQVYADPDPDKVLLSESFQKTSMFMERTIMVQKYQSKLAAYRNRPILPDPYSTEEGQDSFTPTLERLWAFTCKLTTGYAVRSIARNKKNPHILAVGYSDSKSQKPGLICGWSIKNPEWPERVFSTPSGVTSLDFSANNPGQLAAGMHDGSIAFYNVFFKDNRAFMDTSTLEFPRRHLEPVWQVTWTKIGPASAEGDRDEALLSASQDGRITKWFFCPTGLDCLDLMNMKRLPRMSVSKKEKDNMLDLLDAPARCIHFHPTVSLSDRNLAETSSSRQCPGIYLVGAWDGLIHKCSLSESERGLDTYAKHLRPVNAIEWSPFSPDVFLSCSSDWTIRLWKQGTFRPLMTFRSVMSDVVAARWSPDCSTVFAAINREQLEVWDLNSSIEKPTIVHRTATGVAPTSLLFGSGHVLVGDSEGQVTVFKIQNLQAVEGKQASPHFLLNILDLDQRVVQVHPGESGLQEIWRRQTGRPKNLTIINFHFSATSTVFSLESWGDECQDAELISAEMEHSWKS